MAQVWKVLLGLVVSLPLAAVVTGVVAASSVEDPAPRETIVIQDVQSRSPGADGPAEVRGDGDKGGDESGDEDEGEVRGVRLEPDDLDDPTDDATGGGDLDDPDEPTDEATDENTDLDDDRSGPDNRDDRDDSDGGDDSDDRNDRSGHDEDDRSGSNSGPG